MSSLFGIGAGSGASGFYNGIATQSLRFDSANTAYLYRTNSSNANRKKFTWSGWLKKSVVYTSTATANQTYVLSGGASGTAPNDSALYFDAQAVGSLNMNRMSGYYYMGDASGYVDYSEETNAVFRDVSAWYHIVLAVDTTQSTASDRIKYYVNGTLQTSKTQYYGQVPQDMETSINNNVLQNIGRSINIGDSRTFDGYMAEVNFVDGFQYDASYFGQTKSGVWIAKEYTGSYGTNGYRLEFKQTGTGTASSSTIGADTSGNNNHWTSSGIVASDCNMPDSPENNFCIASPIFRKAFRNQTQTASEGNLKFNAPSTYNSIIHASMVINEIASQGGVYFEARVISGGASNNSYIGVLDIADDLTSETGPNTWNIKAVLDYLRGYFYKDGSSSDDYRSVTGIPYTTNDIIGIAIKSDGKYFMHKNGTYFNQLASGSQQNPSTGSNEMVTLDLTNYKYVPFIDGESAIHFNFGQDSTFGGAISSGGNSDANGIGDFAYAVPSGFLALCTANLPEPSISPNADTQADDHFNTVLISGNSGTQAITGVGFQPDWSWNKTRNVAEHHILIDSNRGDKALRSNENIAEYDTGVSWQFDTDGFTMTGTTGELNYSGRTYVSWNWKANGTTPTKTYKVKVVADSTDYGHGTGSNKYQFLKSDGTTGFGTNGVDIDLQEGGTYIFDWSDSTAQSHPIRFSLTNDGTHSSGTSAGSEYTTGVVKDDSAYTTTITVASGVANLYYYCQNHSGMGAEIRTNTTHGSTNFDGSILSVSNANTLAGFSIVTYEIDSSGAKTVGHGLTQAPQLIINKGRDQNSSWWTFTTVIDGTLDYVRLNDTTVKADDSLLSLPTSTIFGMVENYTLQQNAVAYCFHSVEGYSKIGSYVGNNSTDGTFVYTGFRPQFLIAKNTSTSHSWNIQDIKRADYYDGNNNGVNPIDHTLLANTSDDEFTSVNDVDFLSNGFKWRYQGSNNGTGTYIYMAFAEAPFKFANAR